MAISKSSLVDMLQEGFATYRDQYERLLSSGEVFTLIISDATFTVPSQIGGANVIASRQRLYADGAVVLAEVLTRT